MFFIKCFLILQKMCLIAMIFQFLLVGADKCLTHGAADDLRL